ncbi:MAG: hypothetical protein P8P74_04115 [Crocinitomicaceae bacterium]|nr:hypothetical protein [Crocinitomicaceae bacterium]
MEGLKNYREKLKSIERLVEKMESGELSINELVELEGLTRDLHERSIILKYKAFENRTADSTTDNEEVEIEEEELDVQHQDEEAESDSAESDVLFEAEETPVMDFSMFDAPATDAKVEESKEESTPEVEPEKPAPVVENKPEHKIQITTEPVEAPKPIVKEPIAEEPKADPEVKPAAEAPKAVVNEKGTSFLDRLNITDNSISSQLAGRKIDSLSGAFGINQRLLYINELFDGSGEDFSDAIKTLDSQPSLDEASTKVEELAFKNSWDPEEETVLEFLAIIKRRYV